MRSKTILISDVTKEDLRVRLTDDLKMWVDDSDLRYNSFKEEIISHIAPDHKQDAESSIIHYVIFDSSTSTTGLITIEHNDFVIRLKNDSLPILKIATENFL